MHRTALPTRAALLLLVLSGDEISGRGGSRGKSRRRSPGFRAKRGCLSIAAPYLAETEAGLTSGRPWASRCRSLPQLGRGASRPGRTGRRPRAQTRNRVDRA